jgi:acetate kinase
MRFLLTLNTGSSSVKFRLFGLESTLPLIAGGKITDIGNTPVFKANREGSAEHKESLPATTTQKTAVKTVLQWLEKQGVTQNNLAAIAHRIVHGGERYTEPVKLDEDALEYLRSLNALAPLHQPHNLAGVDLFASELPSVPQYGCFDTAFHTTNDKLHFSFALPENIRAKRVRRYGFHGLSYAWIVERLKADYPHLLSGRVVAAHLGNGASLCAIKNGCSVDTTMGMTALDGLPMGTRSGALDAGVVFYMLRDLGIAADEAERILYEDSGLKGLSGITNDVKALSESDDERAAFALDYFCLKTAQNIAAMAVSIGGMDALVFSGGIGENARNLREKILAHLSFLPAFEHHVIAANEERGMAQDIWNHYEKDLKI